MIPGLGIGPARPVRLRHGLTTRPATTATVRVLTGADEAALGGGNGPGGEHWVTLVLATAVAELGGSRPEPEELRALSVGDRNALLLALVASTYGSLVEWVLDCPSCGERLDAAVDLVELLGDAAHAPAAPRPPAGLPAFRLPTGADLEALAELLPAVPGPAVGDPAADDPAEQARRLLLDRCVTAWHTVDEATVAAVETTMAATDPLADIELLLSCAACAAPVPAVLDPAAELAARLTPHRRLMTDVHALALAYGWTEPEVLALPAPRRAGYLTLIADGEAWAGDQ
ncbi:hypothetical protein [Streptomyces sp. 1331.2]|uniref:hypothetical protein n=1 Tax=Streptomyces sp. 1331.2 TaxID=1938835 RepID=UPI000BD07A84|nr:hypothetical protein [Streptomyces sp. 1331.2]SOB86215.1 hypothetical protein SAMN06272789_6523 [Streptomyces sp. 1331.2]